MPGMTPYEFYEGFVFPNYSDWQKEPTSVRLAFNTAVAAFHLADHYCRYFQNEDADFLQRYGEGEDGLKEFQATLVLRQSDFKTIQDMANAYKHLYTRTSCSIASGGAITCIEYEGDKIEADYEEPKYEVVIRHRNGAMTKFSKVIESVLEMWTDIVCSNKQPAI